MKYHKMGIFLEPGSKMFDNLMLQKTKFKKRPEKQSFINDPPHCTLLHGFYLDKKKLINKFNKLDDFSSIEYKVKKTMIFKNDLEVGNQTLCYKISDNENITSIQKLILGALQPDMPSQFPNLDKKYSENLLKYSFPFVGQDLIPHFSVSNIRLNSNNKFIQKFLSINIDVNEYFKSIFIGEIIDGSLKKIEERYFAL
jgi:hypothetical protein